MADPRGAAAGSATEAGPTPPHPTTPPGEPAAPADAPTGDRTRAADADAEHGVEQIAADAEPVESTEPVPDASVHDHVLDASVHDHVLDDPLPPVDDDADTPLFEQVRPRGGTAGAPIPAGAAEVGAEAAPTSSHAGDGEAAHSRSSTSTSTTASADVEDEPAGVARTGGPLRHAHVGAPTLPLTRRRAVRVTARVVIGVALVTAVGLSAYLYESARGWRDHADGYLSQALDLGDDLATSRTDLAGARAELAAVREQLATAHQRITELASEKAQLSDEWEITQQLVDYQERVSDAAGQVALALDQCVQGQQELIGYLARAAENANSTGTPPPYDPGQLALFETDVETFCQGATEANIDLQRELAR